MNKRILYLLDNANYSSGVQKATALQIKALSPFHDITVFSLQPPTEDTRSMFFPARFLEIPGLETLDCLNRPAKEVLFKRGFSLKQRLLKLRHVFAILLGRQTDFFGEVRDRHLREIFEAYDFIVVVSEGSVFRSLVSTLTHPQKIQWIHTNYKAWRAYSAWTKGITEHDAEIYARYDTVVTLNDLCRKEFLEEHPHLADKTRVIRNLIDRENILRMAEAEPALKIPPGRDEIRLITVGRMETEKNLPWVVGCAERLRNDGIAFCWYLVGDGPLRGVTAAAIEEKRLQEHLFLLGHLDNPYPLMKTCDLFVLLSGYEGTPVTIEEAKVLCLPVLATNVGGIGQQILDGITGKLTDASPERCYTALLHLIQNRAVLENYRRNLRKQGYDDSAVLRELEALFC